MEDAAGAEQPLVQLIRVQQDVCAGLAVEAEIPITVGEGVHHGKRRGDHGVAHEGAGVDPGLAYGALEHVAKAVFAHLADEGTALAELAEHCQHIGRGPAGIGFKKRVALLAQSVLGEVHQQLAQSDNVKFFLIHSQSTSCHII